MPSILAELDVGEMREHLLRVTLLYIMLVTAFQKLFAIAYSHVMHDRAIT